MKIEITDRQMWLDNIEKALANIEIYRKKEDEKFVARWRAQTFLFGLIKRDQDSLPDPGTCFGYPSCRGWGSKDSMETIQKALNSTGTGSVFIEDKELNDILSWMED